MMAVGGTFGGMAIAFLKPPAWVAISALAIVAASAAPTLPPFFVEWSRFSLAREAWKWGRH